MSYGMIWYLLYVLDKITIINTGLVLGFFIVVGLLAASSDNEKELIQMSKTMAKWVTPAFVVTSILFVFLPTKKDAIIILGLNLAQTPIETAVKDMGSMYPELKELIKQELGDLKEEMTADKEGLD